MAKIGLGKGINALIPELLDDEDIRGSEKRDRCIPIEYIKANPNQPRKTFNDDSLVELSESIRVHGIIQPIIVQEESKTSYVIVAGERRYRAAILAGVKEIPVLIRDYSEEKKLEIALIENIQRENLNPVDEAMAYKSLMEITKLNQDQIASRVGKNRSTVANAIRLLKLPVPILESLAKGEISSGHARALLSVEDKEKQSILFQKVIAENLSVREVERAAIAKDLDLGLKKGNEKGKPKKTSVEIREIEEKLIEVLGTKIAVKGTEHKGIIEISYFSMEDLERVYKLMLSCAD